MVYRITVEFQEQKYTFPDREQRDNKNTKYKYTTREDIQQKYSI